MNMISQSYFEKEDGVYFCFICYVLQERRFAQPGTMLYCKQLIKHSEVQLREQRTDRSIRIKADKCHQPPGYLPIL